MHGGRRNGYQLNVRVRRGRAASRGLAALVLAVGLIAPQAPAAFPGSDPDESVRINTPDDPGFDHCESDDEQGADCSNVFGEEYERFGFAPDASENTALVPGAKGDVFTIAYADEAANWGLEAAFPASP